MARKRLSRGVLGLGAAAAFSFGAITNIATADHYHVNCNNHGLVHGSSTADSNYHSRVEGSPCVMASRCKVGQWGNNIREGWGTPGATCNIQLVGYGPECGGTADVFADKWGPSFHRHYAHNRC